MRPIPVLLYHSVSDTPSSWIARYNVTPREFARHMDVVAESERTAVTLSRLRAALTGRQALPPCPVVITFDDGFADTLTEASPVLVRHGFPATVYVTTGVIAGRSPGGDGMLDWSQLAALLAMGHEIGAHSHTHPCLDTLPVAAIRAEVTTCKDRLEEGLGVVMRSFAYPFGYSDERVRRLVRESGYESACGVKNALSPPTDPAYSIARLAVTSGTSAERVREWLDAEGVPVAQPRDTASANAWRAYRRVRTIVQGSRTWEVTDAIAH